MRRTIALAAALAAFSLSAACGEELTEGDRKLFKWFDGLGFANLAGLKYVRVGTGNWNRHGDDPPQNRYVRGFLLADAGDTFRVLHMDLSVQTYTRTGPGVSEHQRVHFTELDLQKEAEALLANLKRIHSSEERDHWRRFGARLSERSEVFILARACAAKGHDRIARQLLDFAAAMPERRTGEPPKKTLQSVLEDEIGHAEMWRAVLAFGDASVGRKALLGRFAGIVRSYPNSQHIQRAKDTVKLLKQMVAEEKLRQRVMRFREADSIKDSVLLKKSLTVLALVMLKS